MSKKIRGPRGLSLRSWPVHQPQVNDVVVRFECRARTGTAEDGTPLLCRQPHPTAAHPALDALNLTAAPAEVRAAHARAVRRWQIATEKDATE
jgi:hypothetical protein